MKYRIESYRDGTSRLFLGRRAERYLVNLTGTRLYETRSGREWRMDFDHPDDAAAFVKQFLPDYAEKTRGALY
jgi:hypothetical protein